ncbi:unnamed protein product [Musa banksii]
MADHGGGRDQQLQPLTDTEHGSFHGLTLNEVQSRLGEPLHGLSLGDLLERAPLVADGLRCSGSGGVPRALSKKTIVEAWRDIQLRHEEGSSERAVLGEMTVDDFLPKAGAAAQGTDSGVADAHAVRSPGRGSNSSAAAATAPPRSRRRRRVATEDVAEKMVERRQKRMIKNRESAARSRARRQAYTNELENKVVLLEEENQRLGKHKAFIIFDSSSLRELEAVERNMPHPDPKHQLRRTSSAPF